ncbi:MAG: hypothetical protein KDB40_13160 [Acidimicrobiales bacterium]|nr:hypothetical protein [Acidimicrobiales bacterium]MCB9392479.1 hypothetical protein [Acidimicrobiaceae bacterium]
MTLLDARPPELDDDPSTTQPVSWQAQAGRWRTAARLARREMRRRPWRTLLAVLLIAAPVGALVVADVAFRSALVSTSGAQFGRGDVIHTLHDEMDVTIDDVEAALPPDATFAWTTVASAIPLRSLAVPDDLVAADVYVRDATESLFDGQFVVSDGRLPTAPGEVFLTASLAEDFGVAVGDQLGLVRPSQVFTVVGVGRYAAWDAPIMIAPGFDVSVLRPSAVRHEVLWTTPAVHEAISVAEGGGPLALDLPSITYDYADPVTGESFGPQEVPTQVALDSSDDPEPAEVFLGWLFGVLLLGATGVVVAAAFAVSGRRQLVTVGQLSASGADPILVRRFLALQGTWTGLAGTAVGFAAGATIAVSVDLGQRGRTVWSTTDLVLIAATALAVSTLAALAPTRTLATTSVLTALAGRRPVPPVRARQVSLGTSLIGGALVVIFLSVVAARTSSEFTVPLISAVLASIGLLVGVCLVCPAVVDTIARFGGRGRGVAMLATRSLGRHRARSASLLAAVIVITAAGTAVAATGEQAIRDERSAVGDGTWAPDVIAFAASDDVNPATGIGRAVDPEEVDRDLRRHVEDVVGPVRWAESAAVGDTTFGTVAVATDEVLDLLGLEPSVREQVAALDEFQFVTPPSVDGVFGQSFALAPPVPGVPGPVALGEPVAVVATGLPFGYFERWVSPEHAAALDLDTVPVLFGRADTPLTDSLRARLGDRFGWNESWAFRELAEQASISLQTGWSGTDVDAWAGWLRLGTVGGALLLVAMVIAFGMALWAAEGRDERDTLVALGAAPAVLARTSALKAWTIATTGAVLGVALGWGTLRVAVSAAAATTTFPVVFVATVVLGVPAVIGVATWLASAAGQRLRPVTASSMAE